MLFVYRKSLFINTTFNLSSEKKWYAFFGSLINEVCTNVDDQSAKIKRYHRCFEPHKWYSNYLYLYVYVYWILKFSRKTYVSFLVLHCSILTKANMSYEQTLVEGISTLKIFCRLPELKSKGIINVTSQIFL